MPNIMNETEAFTIKSSFDETTLVDPAGKTNILDPRIRTDFEKQKKIKARCMEGSLRQKIHARYTIL